MADPSASACTQSYVEFTQAQIEEHVPAKVCDVAASEVGKLLAYAKRGRSSRLIPVGADPDQTCWRDLDAQILYSLKRLRGAGAKDNAADCLYLFTALEFDKSLEGARAAFDEDEVRVAERVSWACYEIGRMKRCTTLSAEMFDDHPDRDKVTTLMAASRARLRAWGYMQR